MAVTYNVVRGDGVFFEGLTKEQIYELIAEMTGETVQDVDQAFITKLKEINKGNSIRLWLGTSAEYNLLQVKEDDVLYICTDDTFVPDTNAAIQELSSKIDSISDGIGDRLSEYDEKIDDFKQEIESDMSSFEREVNSALGDAMKFAGLTRYDNGGTRTVSVSGLDIGEMRFIALSRGTGGTNSVTVTGSSSQKYMVIRYSVTITSDSDGSNTKTTSSCTMTFVENTTTVATASLSYGNNNNGTTTCNFLIMRVA